MNSGENLAEFIIRGISPFTYFLFAVTTLAAIWFIFKALGHSRNILVISIAWLAMQSGLALSGFYLNVSATPPHFLLAAGVPFLFIIFFLIFRRKNVELSETTLKWFTLLHLVRIPVEIVLYFLAVSKAVPQLMTFEGSNPDILSGITAPIIWWLFSRKKIGRNALILWNLVCLGLLFNIVIRAVLSAPLPFQQFAFDQPNIAVLYFPFVLLPAYIVPTVLFSHLFVLTKLFNKDLRKTNTVIP